MKKQKPQRRTRKATCQPCSFCWLALLVLLGTSVAQDFYRTFIAPKPAIEPVYLYVSKVAKDPHPDCFPMLDETGVHTFCGSPDYPFQ